MTRDEEEIRELIETWMSASKAGDLETVLSLMTDDVVFLLPGRAPMGKLEFAEISRVPAGGLRPIIEGECDIQEVQVSGDMAFIWTKLHIAVTPPGSSDKSERSGHTLTIFRRMAGKWLLARDANLLTPRRSTSEQT